MYMKNIIKTLFILLIPFMSFSQTDTILNPTDDKTPEYILNGAFSKDHNQNKEEAFDYPEINEKDIVWSRTIWRTIDLRQKMNHHFYFPAISNRTMLNKDKMSLIDVVMETLITQAEYESIDPANEGKCVNCQGTGYTGDQSVFGNGGSTVCPYSEGTGNKKRLEVFSVPDNPVPGNEFKNGPMSIEEILQLEYVDEGGRIPLKNVYGQDSTISIWDATIGDSIQETVYQESARSTFDRTLVDEWRIKEEWYFDKKRSVMEVRIVGLCPVYQDITEIDSVTSRVDRKEMFWIYYPDFRDVLLNTRVTNYTKNNAQERSFLEIFEKRMFVSTIYMESNIMNREIQDYMIGLDALLESERIKEEIFNIEHDMWEY